MFTHPPLARPLRLIVSLAVAISMIYGITFSSPDATKPSSAATLANRAYPQLQAHPLSSRLDVHEALAAGSKTKPDRIVSPGIGGADAAIVPHLVDPSSSQPLFFASGFTPGENINLYINDTLVTQSYQADADGFFHVATDNFIVAGIYMFKAVGLSSHRIAGDGAVAIDGVGIQTETAVIPHAVRHGDKLFIGGAGYPSNANVSVRNGINVFGSLPADSLGQIHGTITTNPASPDGSEVFNADLLGSTGSLAGSSIEERADAGPPYIPEANRAPTSATVDQATGPTGGAYFALGAEGFQAGETVRVTLLSDNSTLLNMAADSRGNADSTFQLTGSQPQQASLRLLGLSSGKIAWASIVLDDDGVARPGALLVPSTAPSGQSHNLLFTKLPPSTNVALYFDVNQYGNATSDANGLITTTITTSVSISDVHMISSDVAGNDIATVAVTTLTLLGQPGSTGTMFGKVSDAATSQGITGTVTINGVTTPTLGNGNYTIPNIPIGTYVVTATANSPCYVPLTQTVSIGAGLLRVNFPLNNICTTTTPTPLASTPTNTATAAPTSTPTATSPPQPTNTLQPTNTPGGPTNTPIPTNTPAPSNTPGGPTDTPVPSSTPTPTNTPPPTNTPGGPTNTPAPTNTPGGPSDTPVPTITPTDCPNPFIDINANIFYFFIHTLNCEGVINGTDAIHYSPSAPATRGQFAKLVVRGFGFPFYTPSDGPTFSDVPTSYFAFAFIETAYNRGIVSGANNGSCLARGLTPPCFLPNDDITRAQVTKLIVNAHPYVLITPIDGPHFADVPASYWAYAYVETAFAHDVVRGTDGTHFEPNRNVRRDELAKMLYLGIVAP